jgi:hypothetical protein
MIKIDIPIYFGYLVIIFTDDVKAVSDKHGLGLEEQFYPAFVQGNRNKAGVSQYWMVFDKKHIDHTIVAHEVVHCANWIFLDRRITIDPDNDEPYAYLVGWITSRIYKEVYKNKIIVSTNLI